MHDPSLKHRPQREGDDRFPDTRRGWKQPGLSFTPKHAFPFRYPQELEEWASLRSGRRVLLRPYRPGDQRAYRDLFSKLAPMDIWFRFFSFLKNAPEFEMKKFRDINYAENLKFVANAMDRGRPPEMIGVIGLFLDVERSTTEFALIVRTDQKRQGLGRIMLNKVIGYARCQGYRRVVADVIRTNLPMLNLATSLGFEQLHVPGDEDVIVSLRI